MVQPWVSSPCQMCGCSLGRHPVYITHAHTDTVIYMLTTVTLTLVFTFMATKEAVEVSNLCRVMQEVSLCYLVISAKTPPHICLFIHTHIHAHTQTDMHTPGTSVPVILLLVVSSTRVTPKSVILAFQLSVSSRMLLVERSRWMYLRLWR